MILTPPSTLRFASALTRQADAQAAADELIRAIRVQLGSSRIDVAFLFISAQLSISSSIARFSPRVTRVWKGMSTGIAGLGRAMLATLPQAPWMQPAKQLFNV